jgi:RNA polymerase sigma-70 factor, ECF subfamily
MEEHPLAEMLRIEGGRVLATLIRFTGDIDLAEEAVHDAVVIALERWERDGIPDNPAAWITTVARRRALDHLRRESRRTLKESVAEPLLDERPMVEVNIDSAIGDDRLRLLFTCCHPALGMEARVALALRTLCRLTTPEIARAFLVSDTTMGQRISRAKSKIASAHIPYRIPDDHELPERLDAVLATIYLVFTAGHHAAVGSLDSRVDLADEGIRLGRLMAELMPDEPECVGLVALLLATNARRRGRVDVNGELILMADQDRSLWDHDAIGEAAALVESSLTRHRPGPYQIQAAIATLHGLAPTYAATDWPQIAELYRLLEHRVPTPVVRVNRAVAEAEVHGAAVGLAMLDDLLCDDISADVTRWHLYWATRADFLRRLDRISESIEAYDAALNCSPNESDRRFLQKRRAGWS